MRLGTAVLLAGMGTRFSINFDYRCPFARNANEHVLAALEAGADYDVDFLAFSLDEVHVEEGEPSVFEQPERRPHLAAGAAGIVVRDRMPDRFHAAHRELFAARHDHGGDLRDPEVIAAALQRAGIEPKDVFVELEDGWPYEVLRAEHQASVADHAAFGVPTFVVGERAAFVRLMTRPQGDAALAKSTIDRVLELVERRPELNELKHTTIPK